MVSFILSLKRLLEGLFHAFKRQDFLSLFATLCFILLSGTLFYRGVEKWSWLDSFYFSFISLIPTSVTTTFTPVTTFGKIFTMIYLMVGVGIMFMILVTIGRSILKVEDEDFLRMQQKKKRD
ncbi:ion channel [Solibacillus sp. FSL R7-0668]|uniref:ion channel n=1 Tax=Solibacillus sp. FSL R7-0668 TaxID=2921688 RepID=UPI0030F7274E